MSLPKYKGSDDWLASQFFLDEFSLRLHREIAKRLRRDASEVMQIARKNLSRWLAAQPDVAALLEWKSLLENSSLENLIEIITENTDESQRLRSSSPFAGVLSEAEREAIWRECAKREFA